MKKKDYELIAGAVKRALELERNAGFKDSQYVVLTTANSLATALGENDPKFDSQKFYQQCGFGLERLGFDLPQDPED